MARQSALGRATASSSSSGRARRTRSGSSGRGPNDRSDRWYVNLQAPFRRTAAGFDTQDHELDIVIVARRRLALQGRGRGSTSRSRLGRWTEAEVTAIRAEGARVAAELRPAGAGGTSAGRTGRPDPTGAVPHLPEGWDRGERRGLRATFIGSASSGAAGPRSFLPSRRPPTPPGASSGSRSCSSRSGRCPRCSSRVTSSTGAGTASCPRCSAGSPSRLSSPPSPTRPPRLPPRCSRSASPREPSTSGSTAPSPSSRRAGA